MVLAKTIGAPEKTTYTAVAGRAVQNPDDAAELRRAFRTVLVLAVLALGLRVLWGTVVATTVEREGSFYARLAQNIAHRRGYLGIREQGLQLIYPPLFPLLIALQNSLGIPADLAGRLISAVASAAFVPLAFLLAYRLYGIRVARIAAILAAIHPLLVVFGAAVLTEMTYLTLIWAGVYFALQMLDDQRFTPALLAGTMFGLGYLTRPEAMLLPPIVAAWFVLFAKGRRSFAVKRALALVGVFGALAAPYIIFLYLQTGQLRFEAKTAEGRVFSRMVAAGIPIDQIYHGVDPDLTERGLSMIPNLAIIRMAHSSPRDVLDPMINAAKSNLPRFLAELGGGLYFGNPVLFGLAVLGLFSTAWSREQLVCQSLIIAVSATAVLALTSWPYWHERFQFPLAAVFILWGAAGLTVLARWTSDTLRNVGVDATRAVKPGQMTLVLTIVALVGISAAGVRHLDEVSDGWSFRSDKEVGLWMRTLKSPPRRLADTGPIVAFYSGAALTLFPHCAPDVALRYFQLKGVDTIVLRTSATPELWMFDWIQNGIPSPRAELIAKIAQPDGTAFIIYRFHGRDHEIAR